MMIKSKIIALIYLTVSSVTVLVMLTTSFEQFGEKYLPSFLLAQKYALPLIVSTMAIIYLVFFEPERLEIKKTVLIMRTVMTVSLGLFSLYITTLETQTTSSITVGVYIIQWLVMCGTTILYFLPWKQK